MEKKVLIAENIYCDNNIGLEIECPFNFYFQEIYDKYFKNRLYYTLSETDKSVVNQITSEKEKTLLPQLEKASLELGLTRGTDRYREFVFPATKQLHQHIDKVKSLIGANLLPIDQPLSTHITIGNISRNHAFAILFYLEKKYLTKNRLNTLGGRGKGGGGIKTRHSRELMHGDIIAHELRTLKFPMSHIDAVMSECKHLLGQKPQDLISASKNEVNKMGLERKKRGLQDTIKYSTYLESI